MDRNPVYTESQLMFQQMKKETVIDDNGIEKEIDTGIFYLSNGDIKLRLYLPGAKTVKFQSGVGNIEKEIELNRTVDGFFEGIIKYDPLFVGPFSFELVIDGNVLIYPYFPISWHCHKPMNYIDIPSVENKNLYDYLELKDVPHGAVTTQKFFSESLGDWARCLIYTPPGYMNNQEKYPVLYLLHGLSENETVWEYNAHISNIMDNSIASGECNAAIVVMCNGMVPYGCHVADMQLTENLIVNDIIPFIDQTYRTFSDKTGRAMAGLSMGSIQTAITAMNNPELFNYIGLFSGFLRNILDSSFNNTHLLCLNNKEIFEKNFTVFYRSIGEKDNFMEYFLEDDIIICEKGIDRINGYHREVFPDLFHSFGAWRLAFRQFIKLIF